MTPQMSVGMKAYARELSVRLPRVAPDLYFVSFHRGRNFGFDEQLRLPLAMRAARPDISHFLSLYTPLLPPKPYIVTIHDLIHLRFPQYFKSKVGPYYRTAVRFVCRGARAIITDDERTVTDLQRFLGVDPARVHVIPLGADDVFYTAIEPYRPARPYIMYAGNHRAHKDLATLFESWATLPSDLAIDLYVTGNDDFGELRQRYARMNGRIIALGEVPQPMLASYYAGARALVHPALWEGFGLPMLEAAAVGCPVIACMNAVPTVLRDCVLTFAPHDVAGARGLLDTVLRDEGVVRSLVIQGQARARLFTWDRCAAQTAQLYRHILGERAQ
jgi:glycosyltransferase involved in cell wall biosynthesis